MLVVHHLSMTVRAQDREKEKNLEMIKKQYLGADKVKKKMLKPSEKFKFNFDWEAGDDTSRCASDVHSNLPFKLGHAGTTVVQMAQVAIPRLLLLLLLLLLLRVVCLPLRLLGQACMRLTCSSHPRAAAYTLLLSGAWLAALQA